MVARRRMAVNGEARRDTLIDAAEALLIEEGAAALTARKITERSGMKSQLIYYYFETMDDLILAVLNRVNLRRRLRLEEACQADSPLDALWTANIDTQNSIISSELIALASHRESVREAITSQAAELRERQVSAVSAIMSKRGYDIERYPAEAVVMIATALARAIVAEQALGLTYCHEEAIRIVAQALETLR